MNRTASAWIDIGEVADFAQGATRAEVPGGAIAVIRIGDDFYALGDRCPHAAARLSEGYVFDRRVECPLHGAEFCVRSGEALTLPATSPAPSYRVLAAEGRLWAEAGREGGEVPG